MRTQDYVRTIKAGGETVISQPGQHVALESCSPDLAVRVLIDGADGSNVKLKQGQKFPTPTPFEEITIKNENGVDVDVTVIIGGGDFGNDRISGSVTVSDGGTPLKVNQRPGTTLVVSKVTVGAVSSTIVAPNANRRRVKLQNTHATDKGYYRDDAAGATANDFELGPGETSDWIETTDGINAIRGGANDLDWRIIEERD